MDPRVKPRGDDLESHNFTKADLAKGEALLHRGGHGAGQLGGVIA